MSFRIRLFIAFILAGLLPVIVLAFVVRSEMTKRLSNQYIQQVNEQAAIIKQDLEQDNVDVAESLGRVRELILDDNILRSALLDRKGTDRQYLLNYASLQIDLAGLDMLQLQDGDGRILSSGHFRNEYDRIEKQLPMLLQQNGATIIEARYPEGFFKALTRVEAFQVGNASYYLVGGIHVDTTFIGGLSRTSDLTVAMQFMEEGAQTTQDSAQHPDIDPIVQTLSFPYIDAAREGISAIGFVITHNQAGLKELQASINRWFMIIGGAASLISLLVLLWTTNFISRPIKELADKTSRLDLDKLDVNFASDRKDEIGGLSRLLDKMTNRLRKSTVLIKDAERRAAIGDLARQVNHDIKNGLTPLRNVFRHLSQLSDSSPDDIPAVFAERKDTVTASIDYLQSLATNYARLTPHNTRTDCDLNGLIRLVVKDKRSLSKAGIHARLSKRAVVKADPLSLRRILENLVDNALDSLVNEKGKVLLSTEALTAENNRAMIQLVVADNGIGMTEEQTTKVFQDFYTTKEKGTGLGLSIVRRLVMDLDGSIRVESAKDQGTRFIIDFPAA